MTKQTIYLVITSVDYEGSDVRKAFVRKELAEKLVAETISYDKAKPECPLIEDTAENDALWEKWTRKNKRWEKNHPLGTDAHFYNNIYIQPIELEDTP